MAVKQSLATLSDFLHLAVKPNGFGLRLLLVIHLCQNARPLRLYAGTGAVLLISWSYEIVFIFFYSLCLDSSELSL